MKLRKWKKIGRKNKKREQKFSGNKKEEEKVGSRIRRNFRRIKNLSPLPQSYSSYTYLQSVSEKVSILLKGYFLIKTDNSAVNMAL